MKKERFLKLNPLFWIKFSLSSFLNSVHKNYFNVKDRAPRSESISFTIWWWITFVFFSYMMMGFNVMVIYSTEWLANTFREANDMFSLYMLSQIFYLIIPFCQALNFIVAFLLFMLIPSITLLIRRLKDIGIPTAVIYSYIILNKIITIVLLYLLSKIDYEILKNYTTNTNIISLNQKEYTPIIAIEIYVVFTTLVFLFIQLMPSKKEITQ